MVGSACSGRLEGGVDFGKWKRMQDGRASFRTPVAFLMDKDLSHYLPCYVKDDGTQQGVQEGVLLLGREHLSCSCMEGRGGDLWFLPLLLSGSWLIS